MIWYLTIFIYLYIYLLLYEISLNKALFIAELYIIIGSINHKKTMHTIRNHTIFFLNK